MKYIRKSEDRGRVNLGWLQSKHSFSFGSYHDPKHMGVSVLRVINDDTVMPGQGFDEHGHRDMEIISYVMEGALKHKDSTGNDYIVPAGDVQRMSAGRGIRHSEFNASNTEKVKFLQIWIQPNMKGIEPSYEQKTLPQNGKLTTLVNQNGESGALFINQDVTISRLVLKQNEVIHLSTLMRIGYMHIIKGSTKINGEEFKAGDAFTLEAKQKLELTADSDFEALWFDLPLA